MAMLSAPRTAESGVCKDALKKEKGIFFNEKAHFGLKSCNRAGQCSPYVVESQEKWAGGLLPQAPAFSPFTSGDQSHPSTSRWVLAESSGCRELQSHRDNIKTGGGEGGKAGRLIDEKTSRLVQPAPKPQESISYWASPPVSMATQFGAL